MRWSWFSLVIVLISASYVSDLVSSLDTKNIIVDEARCFHSLRRDVRSLAKYHFDFSLNYLYTAIGFSHQKVERPGLAKYLRELSDSHWESGMKTVGKYIERGGFALEFLHDEIEGSNKLKEKENYIEILKDLYDNSRSIIHVLNKIHRQATKDSCTDHDADWGHFAEGRLEVETKRMRKMEGDFVTLSKINGSLMAVEIFDSHYE